MPTLDKAIKTHVAEVVRSGDKLIIPEGMSAAAARDLLDRRIKFEEEKVVLREVFDTFPWDGAVSLDKLLKEKYGWAAAETVVIEFFGQKMEIPPVLQVIEVGYGKTQTVPWGRFLLPKVEGYIDTAATRKDNGQIVFQLTATIKRKHEETVKDFFDSLRKMIANHSIYRGQALKIRFRDEEGDPIDLPTPKFMDTSHIDEKQLVFSKNVYDAVNTNLFTPIRRAQDCLANGIPIKRGVIMGGTYGCGKTLAAAVASRLAFDNGITFIYAERASELRDVVEFAKQYQSPAAVVFVEDIDREMSGERTKEMDDILNIVDGIDSKHSNIIVVLTTNAMKEVNVAMLRPGRLDAVIEISPPDGEAVERLLRGYGAGMIAPSADLREVGKVLAGNIPAVIAEVVKRAKLSQLAIQEPGTKITEITPAALLEAAHTMKMQIELLKKEQPQKDTTPLEDRIMTLVGRAIGTDEFPFRDTAVRVKNLAQNFDVD